MALCFSEGLLFNLIVYILKRQIRRTHTYNIRLNNRTTLIQRGKIRRTHISYKIEQQTSTKTKGEDQTDIYIYDIRLNNMTPLKQRGKFRRTNIYIHVLRGKIRRTNIYTIRLNNMTPLKQRGKIRGTNIYTKGGDQTDTYIY